MSGLALALAALVPVQEPRAPVDAEHVRGITISCQTWGQEWGTDGFGEELDELAALGVNWIAIHPYARVHGDGRLTWRGIDADEPPVWLARPIEEAHRRGLSILVKPHLAYWGSPFSWRGEIEFDDGAAWARFWADYRRWIGEVASAVSEADAFAVGTELDRTLAHEAEWRRTIAEVRRRTDAHLTYAANWTHVGAVPFWDALDAVGVQAYFPLVEGGETGAAERGDPPDRNELEAGWGRVIDGLADLHRRTGKPVVLTELGYDRSLAAAARPWESGRPAAAELERAEALQALCLDVALATIDGERAWLRGAFLWKWFVGAAPREDFRLDSPRMRAVLAARWRVSGGR